ncbi:MAG: hypothetical protein HC900_00960 [Methylacidiphilales bacterium]|nr:hypothetical protein [Candidatus Methylacidiphilales bacterium]
MAKPTTIDEARAMAADLDCWIKGDGPYRLMTARELGGYEVFPECLTIDALFDVLDDLASEMEVAR